MQEILEDQDLQEVFADPSDPNSAKKFKQAGAKYVVTVKVDGFQDRLEKLHGPGGQLLARKRTIRVSAVAQIYDTTTMELLESANFQLEKTEGGRVTPNSSTNTLSSERLLTELSRQMAHKAANRVIDVLFPAVVLVRRDAIITFNRGDGTNVEKGQEWDVFAKGEELIDPYTGASLGAEEVLVGKAEVIRITPKFSQARLVEDFGVERGNVMRLSKPQED